MPVPNTDGAWPQWAINALIWFAVLITGSFTGLFGWTQRKYILKIDDHEKAIGEIPATYATIESLEDMQTDVNNRLPGLISRLEFTAFMTQMEANFERRHQENRDDRLRMHQENLKNNESLKLSMETSNAAVRSDIGKVHGRVDDLLQSLQKK